MRPRPRWRLGKSDHSRRIPAQYSLLPSRGFNYFRCPCFKFAISFFPVYSLSSSPEDTAFCEQSLVSEHQGIFCNCITDAATELANCSQRMSPRAEEQDSQIVAPNYDYGAFDDSDPQGIHDKTPEINAKATSGHLNSNALHQEFNSSHKSLRSVVEETQFMDLEIETQAGTTQDTQMLGDSPTLKRILQSNNAASPVTLPAKPDEGPSSFLVTRPVAMQNDSATREFKFGTPIKPIPGTYIRQTPKTGSSNSAPPARPEKSTDDELRPIKRNPLPLSDGGDI